MGAAVSNSIVKNTVDSLTTVINSSVSNVTQTLQTSCSGFNTFTTNIGVFPSEIDANGNIKLSQCVPQPTIQSLIINQTARNTCGIDGGITQQLTQDVTNDLVNNISQWLDSEASANNGFLGFGVSIAKAQGINKQDLATQIANTVTTNLSQNCSASVSASNSGVVYFCGGAEKDIVISQSAVNTNLTSCMINNTVTSISSNSVLNDIAQKAIAKASAKNEGVGSLFGWVKWVILAVVILVVVIIIGVLLYFSFGGSKTKPEQKRPISKSERLCILETEQKKTRRQEEGIPLSPLDVKQIYETCVIEKGERSGEGGGEGGEREGGERERGGEGGEREGGDRFDQIHEGIRQGRESVRQGRESVRQGMDRARGLYESFKARY